jgi:hypothetical protein
MYPFPPRLSFMARSIYFYPLKLGVQQQILLGNKTNRNGISVTANFGGGISLAFLRTYNLEINDKERGNRKLLSMKATTVPC